MLRVKISVCLPLSCEIMVLIQVYIGLAVTVEVRAMPLIMHGVDICMQKSQR